MGGRHVHQSKNGLNWLCSRTTRVGTLEHSSCSIQYGRILNARVIQKFLYSVITIPTFITKCGHIFSMWVFRGSFRGSQGGARPLPSLEGVSSPLEIF